MRENKSTSTAHRNEQLMCPGLCLEDNSPFCAMDGLNATKTFSNDCLMEQENCRKRKVIELYEKLRNGPCTNNSNIFMNSRATAFLCANVSVAESVGKCSINCSNSYEPLCAGNTSKNQTFQNSCVFITYQCLYPEKRDVLVTEIPIEPEEELLQLVRLHPNMTQSVLESDVQIIFHSCWYDPEIPEVKCNPGANGTHSSKDYMKLKDGECTERPRRN
ncbi:unnamed protein product [Timema podura]|uniref:Kazal-like domain-containing protein n=1 Tax=Timema podura TaxID=61482 RepID=A0ABN7NTY0_TIMPD|nr:unnamed protein product [Timema podura]